MTHLPKILNPLDWKAKIVSWCHPDSCPIGFIPYSSQQPDQDTITMKPSVQWFLVYLAQISAPSFHSKAKAYRCLARLHLVMPIRKISSQKTQQRSWLVVALKSRLHSRIACMHILGKPFSLKRCDCIKYLASYNGQQLQRYGTLSQVSHVPSNSMARGRFCKWYFRHQYSPKI